MAVRVHPKSRLKFYTLYKVDDVQFWDIGRVKIGGDVVFVEVSSSRIDKISSDNLNSPISWYVIAEANGVRLPKPLYSGVMKVPIVRR